VVWAVDVAAVESREAEVRHEGEDSATVEDVEAGAVWDVVVVEAFLVQVLREVVAEVASAGGVHRLVWFMVFWRSGIPQGDSVAKAGLMVHSRVCCS
jgi:hypothetical protein